MPDMYKDELHKVLRSTVSRRVSTTSCYIFCGEAEELPHLVLAVNTTHRATNQRAGQTRTRGPGEIAAFTQL